MKRRIGREIFGSFVAIVAGWLAGLVALVMMNPRNADVSALVIASWFMWILIFPTWLVAFLPLYLFIPQSSLLWRWPLCTILGVVAGAAILYVAVFGVRVHHLEPSDAFFFTDACVVGGFTCLTAALTRKRFKQPIQV